MCAIVHSICHHQTHFQLDNGLLHNYVIIVYCYNNNVYYNKLLLLCPSYVIIKRTSSSIRSCHAKVLCFRRSQPLSPSSSCPQSTNPPSDRRPAASRVSECSGLFVRKPTQEFESVMAKGGRGVTGEGGEEAESRRRQGREEEEEGVPCCFCFRPRFQ